MILVVQHLKMDCLGAIGKALEKESIFFEILKPDEGDQFTEEHFNHDGLIIMGGTMGAYEEDEYPWLKTEKEFLREYIKRNDSRPILGICLGAQIIAEVISGKPAYPGEHFEFGWHQLTWTKEALAHPIFEHLPEEQMLFHWHADTFELPAEAILLASSELYENQAFIYASRIVGIQFHMEPTETLLESWLANPEEIGRLSRISGALDLDGLKRLNKQHLGPSNEAITAIVTKMFCPNR